MFEFIRVQETKGITEPIVLNELGKINIVCGKNNSGKTSLLEGINTKDKSAEGKRLSSNDIDTIVTIALRSTSWSPEENPNSPEGKIYRKIIEEASQKREVWFSDEAKVFAEVVNESYKHSRLRNMRRGTVEVGFNAAFHERSTTVLLPPKRMLELTVGVNIDQAIQPIGTGILNYLFSAKNQPTSDDNYKIAQSLSTAFRGISNGYSYDIFIEKNNVLKLRYSMKGKPWIDAVDCGLGLQDLLIILYFSIHPDFDVVLVEEPESHLHPELQKKLLIYLKEDSKKQFFISTHSNIFLNNALVDRVFFTYYEGSVKVTDATSRSSILNNLGYSVSDNLMSDLVILVEGPKDVPVIEEFLLKYDIMQKHDIKIWPLGGDIMDQLDLSIFIQSYPLIALIDKDPGSSKTRKRFKENCEELNIPVIQLKRYSIENYFTVEALRKVFGENIPKEIVDIKPDKSIDEQIGFNVKRSNRQIAQAMSIDDIKKTDLEAFFHQVEDACKKDD